MILERNKSYKGDCIELMKSLPDESVDVICTDPPYLYLKNQKLDRPFDEWEYFKQVRRVLKPNGFIILFGRGSSFYRWNTILAEMPKKDCSVIAWIKSFLGIKPLPKAFTFKEEIIWDKQYVTSPALKMSRMHETVSIHTKGNGTINKVKNPYLEMKGHDIESICGDVKRLASILGNQKDLLAVQQYLIDGNPYRDNVIRQKESVTIAANSTRKVNVSCMVMQMFKDGQVEKSIIRCPYDRYVRHHPTQKPVRLIERLLALVCKVEQNKPKPLVLDTFRGSASTDIACMNFGVDCISFEIDDEYFEKGEERKAEHRKNLQPDLFKVAL